MTLQPLNKLPRSPRAISFCCYTSERLSEKKHLAPFLAFTPPKGYDAVLVVDETAPVDFVQQVIKSNKVHVYKSSINYNGYYKHLMRYLTGELGYDWIIYKGTDTPDNRLPALRKLIGTAVSYDLNCIIHPAWAKHHIGPKFRIATGECAMDKTSATALSDACLYVDDSKGDDWNCDEHFLSAWFEGNPRLNPIVWQRYIPVLGDGYLKIFELMRGNRRFMLYKR